MLKRLIETVRDHAHQDVELVIVVRGGTVHYSAQKVKRSRQSLSDMMHPQGAKQLTASRTTGQSDYGDQGIDYAATEILVDLAENALSAGLELHWNASRPKPKPRRKR